MTAAIYAVAAVLLAVGIALKRAEDAAQRWVDVTHEEES